MGQAEVISLDEVRASKQWASLRQQLHDHFDQWLDDLQAQLPEPETTLAQITKTVWTLRQDLTGSLTEATTFCSGSIPTAVFPGDSKIGPKTMKSAWASSA